MSNGYIDPNNDPNRIKETHFHGVNGDPAKLQNTTQKTALVYETLTALTELSTAVADMSSKQVAGTALSTIDASSNALVAFIADDPAESLGVLFNILESKGYLNNPAEFLEALARVGLDIADLKVEDIGIDDIKSALISQLKEKVGPLLNDPVTAKEMSLALAQVYLDLGGSNKLNDINQLKGMLGVFFGNVNPVVDSTIKTYQSAINESSNITNLNVGQNSSLLKSLPGSGDWNAEYNALIKALKEGKLPFESLMEVLLTAPESAEKDGRIKALTDLMKPLIDRDDNQDAFARMLALYFTDRDDKEGSLQAIDSFLNTLVPYMAKSENDPYFAHLQQLLITTKENIGIYCDSDEYDQIKINSELKAGIVTFEKAIGADIKNYNVIHTAPIMMALYTMLMSSDGAYGYLAEIMGNLNKTMKEIGEVLDNMKELNDKLSEFMSAKDPEELIGIAEEIGDLREALSSLVKGNDGSLSDDIITRMNKYLDPKTGTLDQMVAGMGIEGVHTWDDLIGNSDNCAKLQKYITADGGGAIPAPVTAAFNHYKGLVDTLTTQNSAQLQQLNMTTKKVDSLTKLFSAAVTMYKGITQTLTNYSG